MSEKNLKVASVSPKLAVGNVTENLNEIINILESVKHENIDVVAFPELCLSGGTCGDLFLHNVLIDACENALNEIVKYSKSFSGHIIIGTPLKISDTLYNCGVDIYQGKILSITSKSHLSNAEKRWFSSEYYSENDNSLFDIFIGDDFYGNMSTKGLVINISATPALVTKYDYQKEFAKEYTKQRNCSYIFSSAGPWESTTDAVYSGACIIAENGVVKKEGKRFSFDNQIIINEISIENYGRTKIPITIASKSVSIIEPHPFIPNDKNELTTRCNEIIAIQSCGLAKRMLHTHTKKLVLGISGGLDSTLALLVAVNTMSILNYSIKDVICITMPGFGTTDLTYTNACNLVKSLGATLKEINIKEACLQHFNDIGHDVNMHDVTYENTQARERTQILMDYANKIGALLVGTGDLSELALGWCTYNGDHMSMYGVNASIPKTLMQHLVRSIADQSDESVSKILYSVLDTPISPELLPPDKNGKMEQKTENTLGPYEVHDYYLYHFIRYNTKPSELLNNACVAFNDIYSKDELKNWLETFIRRFFNSQFKRSCMPDGPAVGSVSLSPRGAFIMPSDACFNEWLKF